GAVAMSARRRFILPAALVGLASHITMISLTLLQIDNVLASLLASTVTGFLSRPLALRLGAPPVGLMLPGIYALMHGVSIFTAVYQVASESADVSFAVGLSSLFAAILANAALAVGAVLGSYLALPLKNLKSRSSAEETVESVRGAESTTAVIDSVQSTSAKPQTGPSTAKPQTGPSAVSPQTGPSAAKPQTGPGPTQS